jgi:hypothetical protein
MKDTFVLTHFQPLLIKAFPHGFQAIFAVFFTICTEGIQDPNHKGPTCVADFQSVLKYLPKRTLNKPIILFIRDATKSSMGKRVSHE